MCCFATAAPHQKMAISATSTATGMPADSQWAQLCQLLAKTACTRQSAIKVKFAVEALLSLSVDTLPGAPSK